MWSYASRDLLIIVFLIAVLTTAILAVLTWCNRRRSGIHRKSKEKARVLEDSG